MRFCRAVRSSGWILPYLLLVVGCTSSTPEYPAYDVGMIQGTITGGGVPVTATVRARQANTDWPSNLSAHSDSSGHYSIAVPSGGYKVEVRTNSTSFFYGTHGARWDEGDTVHVGRDITRIDFTVGRLAVEVQSSPPFSDPIRCQVCVPGGNLLTLAEDDASPAADGVFRFIFSALPTGTYNLCLSSYDSQIWLPGSGGPSQAIPIQIGDRSPTEYAARLDAWGRISGRLVSCWASEGFVDLIAFDADSTIAFDGNPDSRGAFAMNVLLARPVRILIRRNPVEMWVGGSDFRSASSFDLHAGEMMDNVTLIESGIECGLDSLTEGETGVAISLVDESGRYIVRSRGFDFPIRIPNLRPGAYRLRIEPQSGSSVWLSQWYDRGDSLPDATPIVISQPGEIAHVTLHLIEGGRIRGRILMADGSPALGREITFVPAGQGGRVGNGGTSDWQGGFELHGLEDGDYIVGAETPNSLISWYPGTEDRGAAQTITIRDHGEVDGIDWQVP